MDKETARLIKELEKRGFKAKRSGPSTKKTYDVSIEHVKALEEVAHKRGIFIKDAVAEMFDLWLAKWNS